MCGSRMFAASSPKSKRCGGCGFELFMNASAATAAFIINESGELLAVRRKNDPARGTLDLPGGFVDIGETVEEGVVREVEEETGLKVEQVKYLFSLPNQYEYSGLLIPTADLFFRCDVADTSTVLAMDDAAESLWIPLAEVKATDFGLHSIQKGVARFLTFALQNT